MAKPGRKPRQGQAPNRIRTLREERGWSQRDLVARMDVACTASQISKLENGETELKERWMRPLAKALNVPRAALFTDSASEPPVALVGYVGAGEAIFPFDGDGEWDMLAAPPGLTNGCAVTVRGASMLPVYREGDTLYAQPVADPQLAIGRDCIVQVADGGPRLVKRLLAGSRKNLFRLFSYATLTETEDVRLSDVAVIKWVERR